MSVLGCSVRGRELMRAAAVVSLALGLADVMAGDPQVSASMGDGLLRVSGLFTRTNGVVTLLESSDPGAGWEAVAAFPLSEGETTLSCDGDVVGAGAAHFFRLQVEAIELPWEMVWIEEGQFLMGSPESDVLSQPRERPQHVVRVEPGFWMSKYEVTQAKYQELMGVNPSTYAVGGNVPVETVSWEMAMEYCRKLTAREMQAGRLPEGYVYRLPTEEEWEYACRAGTTSSWSFGDDQGLLTGYAWWGRGDAGGHPHAVGTKIRNAWGLYDMHGNVFEHCLDLLAPYPGGPEESNPTLRVTRGGSFYCPASVVRSGDRSHSQPPDHREDLYGLRVVLGSEHALEERGLLYDTGS